MKKPILKKEGSKPEIVETTEHEGSQRVHTALHVHILVLSVPTSEPFLLTVFWKLFLDINLPDKCTHVLWDGSHK
uniref:Uncharacterized protein n=1 Tax=Anguilla anguilla TaxID=7936 RepID=A0A0E9VCE3_ANGAN